MAVNPNSAEVRSNESTNVRNEIVSAGILPITIRLSERGDVPAIQDLVRDAYGQYVAAEGSEPAPMKADYQSLVEAANTWVAERTGHVVGLLVLEVETDHLLLENIAVASEVRGQGVGRRLLSFAEERALELEIPEIRLYTGEVMTQNLHYYPRHGYRETHRGYEDGHRRVYFSKRVGPRSMQES